MASATPDPPADAGAPPPGQAAAPPLGPPPRDLVGWLASLVVHCGVIAFLAALTFPPPPGLPVPSLVAEPSTVDALDANPSLVELATDLAIEEQLNPGEVAASVSEITPAPAAIGFEGVVLDESSWLGPAALSAPVAGDLLGSLGVGTDGRSGDSKQALVEAKGGSRASEVAVSRAIRWILEHQNPDGSWSLVHSAGACRGRCRNDTDLQGGREVFTDSLRSGTALALLPLLGAGETHRSGRYQKPIARGLEALVRMGERQEGAPGASWMDSGRMYAHGLAAIALTEAYGLTRDPDLLAPAQAAVDFIAHAQRPEGGGWRYRPQQVGDTSVTGWQIMALKSAQLAELDVSSRVTSRARRFLNATGHKDLSRYAYMANAEGEAEHKPTRTLTAVGLLCRMYLGWRRDDPRLASGLEWVASTGPSEGNFYRNYYAAQALFHHTGGEGPLWRTWNEPMRDQLVKQQETRGHERGSWWVEGPHNARGGRLYTTALATMTLEVYYRYLPLYQSAAVETDFPD